VATDIQELLEDSVLLQCRVNGTLRDEEIHPATSLLDFLRDELRLTGTHMGCMTGHCGACTVMIDGRAMKSCITLAASVQRKKITTVEGLRQKDGSLHPIQEAFCEESGFQCGYCSPGMLLSTLELLQENPDPSDEEIRKALTGNLCRCTGYQSIVRAVRTAAKSYAAEKDATV
jgi:carbon-monoxide dehydrogenase small subunit